MNGPEMPKNGLKRYGRKDYMYRYLNDNELSGERINCEQLMRGLPVSRKFVDKRKPVQEPNIHIIQSILNNMGKYKKEDELNCGACGYKTCIDKAKAVYFGYSDEETCLPYLREKAESMQNLMIENSPNVVLMVDRELNILEHNPTFHTYFKAKDLPVAELGLGYFMEDSIFKKVFSNQQNVYNHKMYIKEYERFFLVNIIYHVEEDKLLVFLTDITSDEQSRRELSIVKKETIEKTQEVINKQMRVAQEIASLLGETTAETKMSLKSLNELVLKEDGGTLHE